MMLDSLRETSCRDRRWDQARRLMLLHRENQLLEDVPKELVVFCPGDLTFFHPCVDREQTRLIELLWLQQGVDPVFLSPFEYFHLLLCLDELLLVLTEVTSANVLYFIQFFVVLDLQGLAMR